MDPITVTLGVAAILYGVYTAWARVNRPGQFAKLEAMKGRFGPGPGLAIHFLAYTVVPLVLGAVFVLRGLEGWSLF